MDEYVIDSIHFNVVQYSDELNKIFIENNIDHNALLIAYHNSTDPLLIESFNDFILRVKEYSTDCSIISGEEFNPDISRHKIILQILTNYVGSGLYAGIELYFVSEDWAISGGYVFNINIDGEIFILFINDFCCHPTITLINNNKKIIYVSINGDGFWDIMYYDDNFREILKKIQSYLMINDENELKRFI